MPVRRYYRTLAIIAVLVTLAGLVLGFQTIKIGDIERGSADTPLGLKLGLDLQGGSDLVYRAALKDPDTGEPLLPSQDQMHGLRRTIEERVNASGLGEPNIQLLGDDRLLVQLPGVRDLERAKSLIGETARLEFKHRMLDVARDLPGVTSDEIVSVTVSTREAVAVQLGAEPSPSQATSTEATLAGQAPGTTTEAALGQTGLEDEPPDDGDIPVLVLEFTEAGAEQFANALDRLAASVLPVPGSGVMYPSFLTISAVGGSAAALQVPYLPLGLTPEGATFPLGGEPYIKQIDDTRFTVLAGAPGEREEVEARFGGQPDLVLGELQGRVDEDVGLTGDNLARAYAGQHAQTGLPIVNIEFNTDGARTFAEVTTRIAGTPSLLAIVLDDEELIAPTVRQAITGGAAFIEGRDFTFDRVRDISLLLESGRLPIPIELIQERDVDAILGADSLAKSAVAGLVGLGLVLLFMVMYYRAAGVVAAVALTIYAALILAIFKAVPVTLTLSGVAAAILSIGMAVDANILIFERMKEELRAGRTLLSAINLGFNRAWPAIRDSNVSTLITCAILFWFADTLGASVVKGFAITLAIGVGTSMFSAITMSRTFLRLMAATPLRQRLGLFVPSGGADLPRQQPRPEAV